MPGWAQPLPRYRRYVCRLDDNLLAVIERCLDNGLGQCFVVGEDDLLIGQFALEDARRALLDGRATAGSSIGQCWKPEGASTEVSGSLEVARPVLDAKGRLTDVAVDRSNGFVQVARPDLSHREFRFLLDAFLSSWISGHGDYIRRLEVEFAAMVGVDHAIAVSNGTAALHVALLALGIGPGDEVIVPDLTFAATINAVIYCGATPVIVDIDPVTWGLSIPDIERVITPRTKAIIAVHLYGRPADIGTLKDWAKSRRLWLIEDAAEAHGARYEGRRVGQFGDIGCFSFFANKVMTTGEGGICVTNSESLARQMIDLRNHGMRPDRAYWHEQVGYNYRMTNLQAALGVAQLDRLPARLQRNRRLDRLYRQHLEGIPGVRFPGPASPAYQGIVWLVVLEVPAWARNPLIQAARDADIEMRPFFNPISLMPPYHGYARACPNSMALAQTGVALPTSHAVDVHVVRKVARIVRQVLGSRHRSASAAE